MCEGSDWLELACRDEGSGWSGLGVREGQGRDFSGAGRRLIPWARGTVPAGLRRLIPDGPLVTPAVVGKADFGCPVVAGVGAVTGKMRPRSAEVFDVGGSDPRALVRVRRGVRAGRAGGVRGPDFGVLIYGRR